MKNELLDKGIILPSGEIGKDKINLVAGATSASQSDLERGPKPHKVDKIHISRQSGSLE